MKAIQIDVPLPKTDSGQLLVKLEACGVNFIDIYQRRGIYKVHLPCILGLEGAGIIARKGRGVTGFSTGDRVAFAGIQGSYAEYISVEQDRLVKIPQNLDFDRAAASLLQGMTAHYLVHTTFKLKAGHTCLVHAAAGGVGLLLVQMAKSVGAIVYGTVATEEKARRAIQAGADDVIIYTKEDFADRIKELTDGAGVHVVYDSVGKQTFVKSLNCLRPLGYMVLFGQSSGPVPKIDPQVLNKTFSKSLYC